MVIDITPPVRRAFGRALYAHRTRLKMSQDFLALRAGVDDSLISLYECELRTPTLTSIFSLASALGVRPSNLVQECIDQMQREIHGK